MKKLVFLSALVFLYPAAKAQQSPPTPLPSAIAEDSRVKNLEEQVHSLAEEVALLRAEVKEMRHAKSTQPPNADPVLVAAAHVEPGLLPAASSSSTSTSVVAPPAPAQAPQIQTFGGATSNAKLLNPDISMIGDFIGTAGHNSVSPSPSLQLHESELGLQAIIDPYARADMFLSFGEEGVNVEEGYITFTSLPGRPAPESRQNARRIWQGQHDPQSRPAFH